MISKELLSNVLEEKVIGIILFANEYELENNIFKSLPSIYELAYMCKEWAIKYSGWTLQSYTNARGSGICRIKVGDGQEINKLIASSESEAIFKACEWILDKDSK